MDLDGVLDQLYGLPPEEFTAARNARAKQARAGGDAELARQVQQLSRPTVSAWLVNRLARDHPDELRPLLQLGRELRDAAGLLSGDELRTLTRQRFQVVQALVQRARQIGAATGRKVTDSVADEVRETLDASLADPDVADTVLGGRLAKAVRYAGFGVPGAPGGAAAGPRRSDGDAAAPAPVADLEQRRRQRAREALDLASRELARAQEARQRAEARAADATEAREQAERTVQRLEADLAQARESLEQAGAEEGRRREAVQRAEQQTAEAEQARAEAAARLDELEVGE